MPQDLSPIIKQNGINKTILVQASANQLETNFMLALAEKNSFIAGVVGWVNMEWESACKIIDGFANNKKFVDIRPMIQDIADPAWILNPKFDSIFKKIIAKNLTFDALVKPHQLDHLITLVNRYPDLKVIIDHGGKPQIGNKNFNIKEWSDKMLTLAKNQNVFCKLSGLITEAGDNWTYDDIKPYLYVLYTAFGSNRLIWGSDWPVVNLAGGYDKWIEATERFFKEEEISPSECQAILGGNAIKVYGARTMLVDEKPELNVAMQKTLSI